MADMILMILMLAQFFQSEDLSEIIPSTWKGKVSSRPADVLHSRRYK